MASGALGGQDLYGQIRARFTETRSLTMWQHGSQRLFIPLHPSALCNILREINEYSLKMTHMKVTYTRNPDLTRSSYQVT